MMSILILLVLLTTALWAFTRFYLRGQDLSRYDRPIDSTMPSGEPSAQHFESAKLWAASTAAGTFS